VALTGSVAAGTATGRLVFGAPPLMVPFRLSSSTVVSVV
jgi:hypothetical protein